MSDWAIYMLRCRGGELYTGITTDVDRRISEHASGRGAKALRGKGPLSLVLSAPVGNRSQAQRVEARIKGLSKDAKEALVCQPGGARQVIDAVLMDPDVDGLAVTGCERGQ
jgi:putative endonuclease